MPKKITAKVSREPIDTERMIECVRAIKEREQAKKFIEKEIADYKSEIQAVMKSHGIEEMQCDVFTVRYKEVSSEKFDSTSFKAHYSTLFDKFVKQVRSMRFTIS